MTLRILGILFPVFAVVALGYLYGRWKRPDVAVANQLNMDVFVPALVFWALAVQPFDLAAYRDLAIGGVAVVLGSGLLVLPLVRLLRVDPRTFLPPMMFNNSGNMGIPLALFAFGEEALQPAVVLFIIEMLLHFTLGIYIVDHRARLRGLLRMPMLLAAAAGIAVSMGGWALPQALGETLRMVGQVAIPLLLFSLGVRLLEVDMRDWRLGTAGALLCPLSGLLMVALVQPWLDLTPLQASQLLIFGALPPAVLNYLVAEQYRQEPAKVASMVLIGNLGALLVLPPVLYYALSA